MGMSGIETCISSSRELWWKDPLTNVPWWGREMIGAGGKILEGLGTDPTSDMATVTESQLLTCAIRCQLPCTSLALLPSPAHPGKARKHG